MLEILQKIFYMAFDAAYIFAPICGFIPQIYHGCINYNPLLSLLTIFSNILKLFPSEERISTVLLYQFCFCILVHFYLIRAQLSETDGTQQKNGVSHPFKEILPNFRKIYRFFLISIFSFVILLGILDNLKFSHLFMKTALLLETAVSIMHIKLLERKQSLKLLSVVLLLGDLAKTVLFVVKFTVPKELIIATLIQLSVNVYLVVR